MSDSELNLSCGDPILLDQAVHALTKIGFRLITDVVQAGDRHNVTMRPRWRAATPTNGSTS